jgi:hypothetical protein
MILIATIIESFESVNSNRSDVFEFEGDLYLSYIMYQDMDDFEASEKQNYYALMEEESGKPVFLLYAEKNASGCLEVVQADRYTEVVELI